MKRSDASGADYPVNYAVFAAMLAWAGLPIYIHAPKVYVDSYGVSLAALGAVLGGLRLLDFVQDPALGWLAGRLGNAKARAISVALALIALAMLGLFVIAPPFAPLIWFALTMALLFSAYSFLVIVFYAQGVTRGAQYGPGGHMRLAAWRESGTLIGVCLAAVAPTVFAFVVAQPYKVFAWVFAVLVVIAGWSMRHAWYAQATQPPTAWRKILEDALSRRLLLIALVNAAPVAVSSTLFLFFVETRLGAPGYEGPLLLLFFLSAALAAPIWARIAARLGAKSTLLWAMVLAIFSFGWAFFLGQGDIAPFVIICIASGAVVGADLTLLPAMFARHMAQIAPNAGQAFGLWSFATKMTLAVAALVLLPALEAAGYRPQVAPSPQVNLALSVLYALLPCGLKLVAILLLWTTPIDEEPTL